MAIRTGTTVKWKWGSSWAEGTVTEVLGIFGPQGERMHVRS